MATRRRTGVKSPIPKWRKPPVDTPIQALREFIAKHGHDVAVLTTWTHENNEYQFTTVGSDKLYADSAVNLRNLIATGLELHPLDTPAKDLRGDHPNVSLTEPQLDFLLWILGYMRGRIEKMDVKTAEYIEKYHDLLLPILINSKTTVEKAPKA